MCAHARATKATQAARPVLPTTLRGPVPLLTVGLDQGSVGASGMAYAINHRGHLVHARFDKLHRVVRDMKLALTHCLRGIFMKAQLFTAYIWGLNYRPFGTGAFYQTKRMMVNAFDRISDEHSPIFLKYAARIAKDLGLRCDTDQEKHHVYTAALEADSFHKQGTYPKMGRWFSWNQVAHEQLTEFWTLRMLLEHHLDPDEGSMVDTAFDESALKDAGCFYRPLSSELRVCSAPPWFIPPHHSSRDIPPHQRRHHAYPETPKVSSN